MTRKAAKPAEKPAAETETELVETESVIITATESAASLPKRKDESVLGNATKWKEAVRIVPDFTPTTEVSEWILRFDRATREFSESDKLKLFENKMMAHNLHWFASTETGGAVRTILEWTNALREKYKDSPSQLLQAIQGRKQAEDESPKTYGHELQERVSRYNPNLPEAEKLMYFVQNIHPKYKNVYKFMGSHVSSVAEAIKILENAMDHVKEESAAKPDTNLFVVAKPGSHPAEAEKHCDFCKRAGHRREDCWTEKAANRDVFPGKCYNCKRSGHKARECKTKRAHGFHRQGRDHSRGSTQGSRRDSTSSRSETGEKRNRSRTPERRNPGNAK